MLRFVPSHRGTWPEKPHQPALSMHCTIAKGCEGEIWLLFVRHVREVYCLWYLSAENRNTKPSAGALDCCIWRRIARDGGWRGWGQGCDANFFPIIALSLHTETLTSFSHDLGCSGICSVCMTDREEIVVHIDILHTHTSGQEDLPCMCILM